MEKPKLLYYNDSRHYSLYRYDPPTSLHQLRQPVDEILGTGVDTLVYGLASGQTFLHDTQVGMRWGEGVERHSQGVLWWRAAENLRRALEAGNDPLKVVVDRAHEKGLRILCSLRMNEPTTRESGNFYMLGRLKHQHPELAIGGEVDPDHPHAATCLDFAREEVIEERLAVIEEVCDRYGADGLEMDPYVGVFFKPSTARESAPKLTEFVRRVRALLDRIGKARGTSLQLSSRVYASEEANLAVGMDVRTWLTDGLVDLVIPQQQSFLLDAEIPIHWLVEAAADREAGVYVPMAREVYDDRDQAVTVEMYRAAASNYRAMGADGVYLADLPWPHTTLEYQVIREMSDPHIFARKRKHYFIARQEANPTPHAWARPLPVELEEGVAKAVPFLVSDPLASARADGELKGLRLGVRVVQYCPEDELSFRLNGSPLPPAEVTHYYGGLVSYGAARGGLPARINTHHWFHFELPTDLVVEGENVLEVTMVKHFKALTAERVLHQVELIVDYKEPFQTNGGQM